MPDGGPGAPLCSEACLHRAQTAVAAALRPCTDVPIARPYHVRGCIPGPDAAVTVALWTGPRAREKRNLYLLIPLVSDGRPVPPLRVVTELLRLGRGTHIFGSTGRRCDGRPVLDGSALVEGADQPCLCGGGTEARGPRGFCFRRPAEPASFDG